MAQGASVGGRTTARVTQYRVIGTKLAGMRVLYDL
jgi:hypothetical protein